jgi:glycosyltransferase involved in cell wall biosynthesis
MGASPTISVIMPVYNGGEYVRASINSIISQSYLDFELLVIDDGSTDGTADIVRSFEDLRVSLIPQPHLGVAGALQRGLEAAKGRYIARMDADDVSDSTRFVRQVGFLDRHTDVVLVGTWASVIDSAGQATGETWQVEVNDNLLRTRLCVLNRFIHGSVMMRREALTLVGGYRSHFLTAEDYDLWLRLGEIGSIANLPIPLYQLRLHNGSKSVLEGSLCSDYTLKAQAMAVQRAIRGRDELGYVRPVAGSTVRGFTLTEWANGYLERGMRRAAHNLALRVVAVRPYDLRAWRVLYRCHTSVAMPALRATMVARGRTREKVA